MTREELIPSARHLIPPTDSAAQSFSIPLLYLADRPYSRLCETDRRRKKK